MRKCGSALSLGRDLPRAASAKVLRRSLLCVGFFVALVTLLLCSTDPVLRLTCTADWDPKITTFPGVYIAGVALAHLTKLVGWTTDVTFCSMDVLRFVNVLFAAGTAWLAVRLRATLAVSCVHTFSQS
jgi:hypothetical protein